MARGRKKKTATDSIDQQKQQQKVLENNIQDIRESLFNDVVEWDIKIGD